MAKREGVDFFEKLWENREQTAREIAQRARREVREAAEGLSRGVTKIKQAAAPVARDMARGAQNKIAAEAGLALGRAEGFAKGAIGTGEDLLNAAIFAQRFRDPKELLRGENSIYAQAARGAVDAGLSVADGVQRIIEQPSSAPRAMKRAIVQANIDLNPSAMPAAGTPMQEFQRNRVVGANQGELTFDVGSSFVGGPAVKSASLLGKGSVLKGVDKFRAMGFAEPEAVRLAEKYAGEGHHFIQKQGIPYWKGPDGKWKRMKVPEALLESSWNVLKPLDINIGDFYELHSKVDPSYYGSSIFRKRGTTWSSKDLGIEKYGLAGRMLHGMPTKTLSVLGAPPTAGLLGVIGYEEEEQ